MFPVFVSNVLYITWMCFLCVKNEMSCHDQYEEKLLPLFQSFLLNPLEALVDKSKPECLVFFPFLKNLSCHAVKSKHLSERAVKFCFIGLDLR